MVSQDPLILLNAPNYIMSATKCRVVSGLVCGREVMVVRGAWIHNADENWPSQVPAAAWPSK